MSAIVRLSTPVTDLTILMEALKLEGHATAVHHVEKDSVHVPSIETYGRILVFSRTQDSPTYLAIGDNLAIIPEVHQALQRIFKRYQAVAADRLAKAKEAERLRVLEEQRKLVAWQTETIIAQAKARNYRVKEEMVDGKKRLTLVKMVIQ